MLCSLVDFTMMLQSIRVTRLGCDVCLADYGYFFIHKDALSIELNTYAICLTTKPFISQ